MPDSSVHIALATDANYVHRTTAALYSVLANTRRSIRATIFFTGLRSDQTEKLVLSCAKFGADIEFVEVDLGRLAGLPVLTPTMSIAAYFRILLPDLMPRLHKVLYLDSDVVCRGDIGALWDTDVSHFSVAAVREPVPPRYPEKALRWGVPPLRNRITRLASADYFNSGVLLINLEKWRANDTTDRVLEWRRRNGHLTRRHDQDALNAVLRDDWLQLSARWNFGPWFMRWTRFRWAAPRRRLNPVILHVCRSHGPNPYRRLYRHYLQQTLWNDSGRYAMDEIGLGIRLKAAARAFHFACFPFFYEPAVEYGRVRALPPYDAVGRDIESSANESSSREQWSAYGLQTIALLNEAVVESGESLEGNYAYFDRQRVTQFLSPDPRRTLKRNVLREAVRGCTAILEIGFNAGHSAAIILDANSRVHLTAIDLGVHRYAPASAAVMAGRYPGRFAVHWGASHAIFRQLDKRRAMDFDFIHIDVGHSPRATVTDIAFALRNARPGCTIVIDDAYTPYISKLLHWAVHAGYFDARETAAPPSGENRVFVRTNRPFLLTRWIDLGLLVGPPEVRMRSGLRAMVLAGQNARGRSAEL